MAFFAEKCWIRTRVPNLKVKVMLLRKELDQSKLESETLREELRVRLRARLDGHEPTEEETRAAAAAGITLPDTAAVILQKQRQQLESARKHAELRELADKVEKAEKRTKELMDREENRQWRERIWQRRDDASLLKESRREPEEMEALEDKLVPIVQNIWRTFSCFFAPLVTEDHDQHLAGNGAHWPPIVPGVRKDESESRT